MIFKRDFCKMIPITLIAILVLSVIAVRAVMSYPRVLHYLQQLVSQGLRPADALHGFDFLSVLADILSATYVRLGSVVVITLSIGLITWEIQSGSIKLLLCKPVSRLRIYMEKVFAVVVNILILDALPVLIVFLASRLIGEHLSFKQYIYVVITLLSAHIFVFGFSLFVSSFFSDYIKPAIIMMIYFVIVPGFLMTAVPQSVFDIGQRFFVEYYMYPSDALKLTLSSLQFGYLGIMVLIGAIFIYSGFLVFVRRSY